MVGWLIAAQSTDVNIIRTPGTSDVKLTQLWIYGQILATLHHKEIYFIGILYTDFLVSFTVLSIMEIKIFAGLCRLHSQ